MAECGGTMARWLAQSWFLMVLFTVLAGGLGLGLHGPHFLGRGLVAAVQPAVTTGVILFLMAFSLDSSRFRDALRFPAAIGWGACVNLGAAPLLAWPLALTLSVPDFRIGLLVTAVVPCTLATASVFTRRAGGNDAVSLLVTLATNVACVVVTPLWLQLTIARSAELDTAAIIRQLVVSVLLPTLLGQLAQSTRLGGAWSRRYRHQASLAAQLIVLLLVLAAATNAGLTLRKHEVWPDAGAAVWLIGACALLHTVVAALAGIGGRWFGLSRADAIAAAIAGSQKTLPVGLLVAAHPSIAGPEAPFVTFPLLIYHAAQLIIDSAVADAWAKAASQRRSPAAGEQPG